MNSNPSAKNRARWLPLLLGAVLSALMVGLWAAPLGLAPSDSGVVQGEAIFPLDSSGAKPTPTPAIVTPQGSVAAPEFQGIVGWLNSPPLLMKEQRGKVVLIDFWTYS